MESLKRAAAPFILVVLASLAGAQAEGKHWSYSGHSGPAEWTALDPTFATCGLGKSQSPIDIRGATAADLPAIEFNYKSSPLDVVDNRHTIQLNFAPGSSIDVGGARYELVQIHFHRPSEGKVDGNSFVMEAHLVHRNVDGKLAVVAILLDTGGASGFIDTVWKNLPAEKEKEVLVKSVAIDATNLLPENKGYYTFQGSLTTPPCGEQVTWLVLKTPVKISDAEVAAFAKIYPMNARPTQPLNGREIRETR